MTNTDSLLEGFRYEIEGQISSRWRAKGLSHGSDQTSVTKASMKLLRTARGALAKCIIWMFDAVM